MLDSDTQAFLQTGVSISLAACNAARLACMSRGMGCKVLDGGRRMAIFLKRSQSLELLDNVVATGKVACVFSLPSSNRTFQLKGADAVVQPFDPADMAVVNHHIDEFVQEVVPLGMAEQVVRAVFACTADDLVTVVYSPSAVFSQTPGPKAGEPVGRAS
ncbi:MAG: hypothetical protein EKK49_03270 [Rhodocyclaceae bacterium]|nr:MAG: hypothetical protein EKK49_03270 [Rhodocyclaceae bacterium]